MFGIEENQSQPDQGRDLAGRITSMQYNLAVQQRPQPVSAAVLLSRMLGQALANRYSR